MFDKLFELNFLKTIIVMIKCKIERKKIRKKSLLNKIKRVKHLLPNKHCILDNNYK